MWGWIVAGLAVVALVVLLIFVLWVFHGLGNTGGMWHGGRSG